ncbi:MAG TPA: ABC transporter substrate-binding protein, partial [Acidimicrobiales bacterium]|nr:ABC transporter substrate-binding protein [Acidimicrobiales bacterium]
QMSSEEARRVSRRELLRYGAAGAAALGVPLVAGALPASATGRRGLPARLGRALGARPGGAVKRGGTLKFARSIAPTTLDPANTIIAGDIYTLDKIIEPLYVTSPAGDLTPWLASGYSLSSNRKTYTFDLRPGIKFSDGKPLVAEDVVFSVNRSRSNAAGPLSFLDGAIVSVEADGTDRVVMHLSSPWAPFISDISVFANGIMPAEFGGKSEKDYFSAPVGTGPFTISSFVPDAPSITLQANPHYWQAGKPYLDAVELVYVDNDDQRVLQLQGGQADLIDLVPPSDVASLKGNADLVVDEFPAWEVDLLVMNEKLPYFADRHVRRAITYAIDRPALVAAASFGTAKAGGSFFPPSLQYYSVSTPVLAFSLPAAKAELAKSAYPKGFSTKLLIDGGVQKWVTFAELIKSQLAAIGIDVTITPLAHSAFEATFQKEDYEMFIDYAINDISDPDEMASFELNAKNGGSDSYWSNYDNPAVTALVNAAEGEFDDAKRAALYAQIQSMVAEDCPFVPLDYPPYIYAASKSVQGFLANPGGAYRLEDVWLA